MKRIRKLVKVNLSSMRPLTLGGMIALLAISALGVAAAAPLSPHPVCGAPQGETLVAARQGRIFALPASTPSASKRIFGCLAETGRSRRLSPIEQAKGLSAYLTKPYALSVPWAAGIEGRVVGRDSHRLAVSATDLRTGRRHTCPAGGGRAPGQLPRIDRMVLKPNGSMAWIGVSRNAGNTEPVVAVYACDANGAARTIERGPGINPRSLTLRGSQLSWSAEGTTKNAVLH